MTRPSYNTLHSVKPNLLSTNGSERGSALVEFSLFLPLLLLLLLGIVDVGLAVQKAMILSQAAHAGAMYATLSGHDSDSQGMVSAANAAANASGVSPVTVTSLFACASSSTGTKTMPSSTPCGSTQPLQWAQVTTSYDFSALFNYPLLPSSVTRLTLNGFAEIRVK